MILTSTRTLIAPGRHVLMTADAFWKRISDLLPRWIDAIEIDGLSIEASDDRARIVGHFTYCGRDYIESGTGGRAAVYFPVRVVRGKPVAVTVETDRAVRVAMRLDGRHQ